MLKNRISLGLAALFMAAAATGCGNDAGEIVLVIQTDLSLPKDVSSIRIEVFNNGVPKFKNDYERLGNLENQPILLPGSLTLVGSEDPAETIHIVASAHVGGLDNPNLPGGKNGIPDLRTVREVFTTIPQRRSVALQMPLQFLCDGSGKFDDEGGVTSSCVKEGETCIAGSCQDATIDSSTLRDYTANDLYVPGVCIEVKVCFDNNSPAAVDTTDCSIDAAGGGVNVGLETEGAGICGGNGCFVALDAESPVGWVTRADGRLQLPQAVCDQLADGTIKRVVTAPVGTDCPLKKTNVPTCGPWSAAGAGGTASAAAALAGAQDDPQAIAIGNGRLYWTSAGSVGSDGTVKWVGLSGGNVEEIVSTPQKPRDIVVMDNGTVIWGVADDSSNANLGRIQSLDSGGNVTDIVTGISTPEGLATNNTQIFWTEYGASGVISQANIDGSSVSLLATGYYPVRLVVDNNYVYWIDEGKQDENSGAVKRVPIGGGSVDTIAANQGTPRGLVLDIDDSGNATNVFWVNLSGGTVMRASVGATPGAPEVVASGQSGPFGIAIGKDGLLYWTNRGAGTVVRVPKTISNGTPETVAEQLTNPSALSLVDDTLYWVNGSIAGQKTGALVRFKLTPGG